MRRFSYASITEWEKVTGDVSFEAGEGPRTIEFDVISPVPTCAWLVIEGEEAMPVGFGDAYSVKVSVPYDAVVRCVPLDGTPADPEASYPVWFRARSGGQLVVSYAEPYTTPMPRVRSASSELERVMRLAQLNTDWRLQQQEAAFAARIEKLAQSVAVAAPAAAASAAAAADDGSGSGSDGA